MSFLDKATELEDQIIAWRRDIHMHPELGFEEKRTSRLVADALHDMGIEAEVGVGITGVVGHIGGGEGGPIVGIRADMDALPIHEANNVPYKSQTPGLMHACGHDAHTAMLLGVAKILSEMPNRPTGEIRLLFQPSEEKWDDEGKSGAMRMIDDNALDELDAVIALHVSSESESGVVHLGSGYVMAAVDDFTAAINGEGCHGARPDSGNDPIWIQAQVINAIQAIRSRRTSPTAPSVITVGSIHAGNAPNVIPNQVLMRGTIRSYSEDIRQQLHDELHRAFEITRTFGGDFELNIRRGYPATYNDPDVVELMREVAHGAVGDKKIVDKEPTMGAEDFSYMTQKAHGAMLFLGAKYDDMHRPHHSPIFDIDEASFKYGTAILAETAVRLLNQKA